MSTLITADLHLTDNPRDDYRIEWVRRLPTLARNLKCRTAVIAGDLTEFKDNHSAWLVNFIVGSVHELAKHCRVYVYKGNHDYTAENTPFFEMLGCLEGVTYYTNPRTIGDGDLEGSLVLPHTRNHERDWSADLLGYKYKWVFAHNTFEGADMGHGRRADGIPLDIFDERQRIVSGDVHIPQKLGQLRYVGAPFLIDFGDDYDPRVLVLDGDMVTSHACEGPQKRLIDITMADKLDKLDAADYAKGDIIKVRIEISNFEHKAWSEATDAVKAWAAKRGVRVHQILPVKSDAPGGRVRRKADAHKRDDAETMEDFGRSRGIDDKTMDTGFYIMGRSK